MATLLGIGAALTAAAGLYFLMQIMDRRGRGRALGRARLVRLINHDQERKAGYYPGSVSDPRD